MSDHVALNTNRRAEPQRLDTFDMGPRTFETADIWIGCALIALLAGFAVFLRYITVLNADTSWLITVSEQILAGKKLYVDVAETNPPASVWLYLPIVALAHVLRVSPEAAVTVYIFAVFFFSVGLTGMILSRADGLRRYDVFLLIPILLALFAVMPGEVFSQREHIAVMLCLPFLAATWARANEKVLGWPFLIAAGVCGAVVAIIKPHFVLALELPVLIALLARPRWHTLFSPENVIAGLLTAIYSAMTFMLYPEYWTVTMKTNVLLYLPVADRWRAFTSITTPILLAAFLTSWLYCGRSFLRHPTLILLAAATGFCVAFVVQGKMWLYHVYPVVALVALAGVLAVFDRSLSPSAGRQSEVSPLLAKHRLLCRLLNPGMASIAALIYFVPLFFVDFDSHKLSAAVMRLQSKPTMAILSGESWLGHPVVRLVNGRWGMTQPSLWILANGQFLRHHPMFDQATLPAIEAIENADLARLLADLQRNRPDILLRLTEERGLYDRVRAFPGMADELDRYELASAFPVAQDRFTVNILRRRPDLRTSINP